MKNLKKGDRVVLVEDHRAMPVYGQKGWTGTIEWVNSKENEEDFHVGLYRISFDNGEEWNVNESAVAPLKDPTDITIILDDLAKATAKIFHQKAENSEKVIFITMNKKSAFGEVEKDANSVWDDHLGAWFKRTERFIFDRRVYEETV